MASDLLFYTNQGLPTAATTSSTSTVGEPSVAKSGNRVFFGGNWYASSSVDGGATWTFVDPYTTLPAVDDGFCCDQSILYDPSRDLTFWLLQYVERNGSNTLRVAVIPGATHDDPSQWYFWDFRPTDADPAWTDQWFDYNHAALTNNHLFVVTNAFTPQDRFTRCVVLRMSLDELAAAGSLSFDVYDRTDDFSLRCVQGARETMYFASHNSNSQLRVFAWPDDSPTVSSWDVDVTAWSAGTYSATGPDGHDWLGRCDSRITGGWVARNRIGFLWTANRLGARPNPHVRVAVLDEDSKALVEEPDIWSSDFAYAYPDAAPNDRGHVGVSLFRGGGSLNPGHVVGIWDDYSSGWQLQASRNGSDGPSDGKWGDYLACRRHAPDGLTWVASGYTLQGGSSRSQIEPQLVHFGRRRDERAVERWNDA